jgi:pyruvate/oxaloacetate carboxyltransferase
LKAQPKPSRTATADTATIVTRIDASPVYGVRIWMKVARSKEGDETDEDHAKDMAGYADLLQKLAVWLETAPK